MSFYNTTRVTKLQRLKKCDFALRNSGAWTIYARDLIATLSPGSLILGEGALRRETLGTRFI